MIIKVEMKIISLHLPLNDFWWFIEIKNSQLVHN
jgi:hypothetical protein